MSKRSISDALSQRAGENLFDKIPDETVPGYDAMFGIGRVHSEKAICALAIESLVSYSRHPFKPYAEPLLRALAQSIAENGLRQPIIVRPLADGKYEILAGHNRVEAFRLNGESHIPAIVVQANDDEAAMIVTETNLHQREKLLHSEKAFAYKLQLEAIKHQGKKIINESMKSSNNADLQTCVQIEHKSKSRDAVALLNHIDTNDVRRHVRLTYLISALLDLVDNGKLPFIAGVELSYLAPAQQEVIMRGFYTKNEKIDVKTAREIHAWVENGHTLENEGDIDKCIGKSKKKSPSAKGVIKFKRKPFAPYLERLPKDADLETLFLEFLKERYG